MNETARFKKLLLSLLAASKFFYERGWSFGTSGNLSVVLQKRPLRLAITPSGLHKGDLRLRQIVQIDEIGSKIGTGPEFPSTESLAHLAIVRATHAGAVIHTHSLSSTLVSDFFVKENGLFIEGYEMLKGLEGVKTHKHREWIPILRNSQDPHELARKIERILNRPRKIHGILLHRHGLYTWGRDLKETRRHVEVLEFLLEIQARLHEIQVRGGGRHGPCSSS